MKLFTKPDTYEIVHVEVATYRDAETVFDFAERSRFIKNIRMCSINDTRYCFSISVRSDKTDLIRRQIGALLEANKIANGLI